MNTPRMVATALAIGLFSLSSSAAVQTEELPKYVNIAAKTKEQRTKIANAGVSIEAIRSDGIWGFARPNALARVKKAGFKVLSTHSFETGRGGHQGGGMSAKDFPSEDSRFHNYNELITELDNLAGKHSDIAKVEQLGKTTEGRKILALHINTTPIELQSGQSTKPGAVFIGNHHAREHLSIEIPLMLAQHLLAKRNDPAIQKLLETRDIWILPMLNPDGSEYDIATGDYQMWRKNRAKNHDGTYGVDLNRNYSYFWNHGGASNDPSDETYMGTKPFSENETQAVKAFVEAHKNFKILLSFHTFSELILYPWGHTYDKINKPRDLQVYETMAKQMSKWNGYTPQQSSDLYIASGDTTDWTYGQQGIFSFTFELSPRSMWFGGGFYPGEGVIDKVFNDNLKPCLYMIDLADDPYRVLAKPLMSYGSSYQAPEKFISKIQNDGQNNGLFADVLFEKPAKF